VIRDVATRRKSVEGWFWGVNAGRNVYGFIAARVNENRAGGEDEDDDDDSVGSRLLAPSASAFLTQPGRSAVPGRMPQSRRHPERTLHRPVPAVPVIRRKTA
jgi:hypothetical protein